MDRLIISELSYKNINKIELINKKILKFLGMCCILFPSPSFSEPKKIIAF